MCVFVPVSLCVRICIFVVSVLVCKPHSFQYSPEAESATWIATLLSGLLKHCSDGEVFPSDVQGMHKLIDGFLAVYLLTGVRSWSSRETCSL